MCSVQCSYWMHPSSSSLQLVACLVQSIVQYSSHSNYRPPQIWIWTHQLLQKFSLRRIFTLTQLNTQLNTQRTAAHVHIVQEKNVCFMSVIIIGCHWQNIFFCGTKSIESNRHCRIPMFTRNSSVKLYFLALKRLNYVQVSLLDFRRMNVWCGIGLKQVKVGSLLHVEYTFTTLLQSVQIQEEPTEKKLENFQTFNFYPLPEPTNQDKHTSLARIANYKFGSKSIYYSFTLNIVKNKQEKERGPT